MGPGIPFAIVCASDVLGTIAEGNRETFLQALYLRVSFRDAADSLLQHLQTQVWAKGGSEVVRRAIEFERTRKAAKETPVAFQARRPEILATEFVALRYVAFIRYVMLQLGKPAHVSHHGIHGFRAGAQKFSYPFQAERLIAWEITVVFAALAAVVVFVLAEMETDATLSRITNTDAGKLGFEFYHRLLLLLGHKR